MSGTERCNGSRNTVCIFSRMGAFLDAGPLADDGASDVSRDSDSDPPLPAPETEPMAHDAPPHARAHASVPGLLSYKSKQSLLVAGTMFGKGSVSPFLGPSADAFVRTISLSLSGVSRGGQAAAHLAGYADLPYDDGGAGCSA